MTAMRVPLKIKPLEIPKLDCINVSILPSIHANGIMTPTAITVPGIAYPIEAVLIETIVVFPGSILLPYPRNKARITEIKAALAPRRKLFRANSKNRSSTISLHVSKAQRESCAAGKKKPRNTGIAQEANATQAFNPFSLYSEKRVSLPELLWYLRFVTRQSF